MICRIYVTLFLAASVLLAGACTGQKEPASPLDTYKTYWKALRQKDFTTVKRLMTDESLKMYEQEAKALGITLDDVVGRDSLISQGQKTVEFRNETIEGENATIEVKNTFGSWDIIPFIFEEGAWKIDKKGQAEQIEREVEERMRQLDDVIDQSRQDPMDPAQQTTGLPTPDQPY